MLDVRKLLRLSGVAALGGLLALSSVAPASARNDTARGAAIGGVTGAVIGGVVTGTTGGAVAGGLIGAGTGAAVGASRSRNNYYWRNGRCYSRYSNGNRVRVDNRHCR
ncbi:hypothetical protein [Ancylobacter pratisalsi]|uniref:Glycine zipper domain-containing protein n=1 Tax=Ancylobacter pratisalsi TaxID=1745854 RepID=A0A6P1YIE7_9HYPH|nr:hypothetical protein [Ancylobacter pratisalsi]QIB32491.1 hypothetical protein G3A50_01335 [Ancylobacter pratisalsi]